MYYLWWKKPDGNFNNLPKHYKTMEGANQAKLSFKRRTGAESVISLSDIEPIELTNDEVVTQIKPCPFCHSNDNIRGPDCTEYQGDYYKPVLWLECLKCDVVMYHDGTDVKHIIDKWNNRV